MKTQELMALLRPRYEPPKDALREWAFFGQVRSESWNARTADAIAINLWGSRGKAIHGFELKVSRSDWLKELRQPEKADTIAAYCDFWWLVVADSAIVKDDELPLGWGLLAPTKSGKLKALQTPKKVEAKPLTRDFLVEICRAAYRDTAPEEKLRAEYHRGYDEGKKVGTSQGESWKQAHAELNALIKEFEKTAGFRIQGFGWNGHKPKQVGEAVRAVLEGETNLKRYEDRLVALKKTAESVNEEIQRALDALPQKEEAPT
jgi:hypothetical protein